MGMPDIKIITGVRRDVATLCKKVQLLIGHYLQKGAINDLVFFWRKKDIDQSCDSNLLSGRFSLVMNSMCNIFLKNVSHAYLGVISYV